MLGSIIPQALIARRLQRRLLAFAFVQVAEMALSENVGVLSGPSARRWADSLAKSAGTSGLAGGFASLLGPRLASRVLGRIPLAGSLRLRDVEAPALSGAGLLASALAGLRKDGSQGLLPRLLEEVPGFGAVREVAFLDGNLLFHEPSLYAKHSKRVVSEALDLLPLDLGALLLAARTLLNQPSQSPSIQAGTGLPGPSPSVEES